MTNDKITKAKVQLILTQPFFATLALGMKFEEDRAIKTACTNGKKIKFNPDFIEKLDLDQVKGLIAHEVMHVASLHHTRRNERNPKKWNIAADYAINQLLIDSGFKLPENGCIDKAFKDLSTEDIFNRLPDPPHDKEKEEGEEGKEGGPGAGGGEPDPGGCGGVEDAPGTTASEVQQIEAETKQLIAQAAQIAKQQGKLPAHLERLVNESLEAVVSWKDVLNVFLTEVSRNDYTFKRPSKRYISQGLYLPSLESIEKGNFILIIDTSGSIDQNLLSQFSGEMQSILADCANGLTIMQCDAELQSIEEFESDDELKIQLQGGGGTDFRPPFEHIAKEGIETACAVYFTDGYCNSFPPDPGFPVLWATYDNRQFVPPFGEVIHI